MIAAIALSVLAAAARKAPDVACEGGDAKACAEAARRYRAGDGVPRDGARLVHALEKGCAAGAVALCVDAARTLQSGQGVRPDRAKAKALLEKACAGRETQGCLDLALLYQNGPQQDAAKAAELFAKACGAGEGLACQLLGDARWLAHDEAGARDSYEKACALDQPSSCTKLADLLQLARLGERAAALYRKACDAKERNACSALALERTCSAPEDCLDFADLCADHLSGYDALAAPDLARAPCEKACEAGLGEACDNLADMYEEGAGVPKDAAQAVALRKKACELGDRDACPVKE